jgi:hypothetical protein
MIPTKFQHFANRSASSTPLTAAAGALTGPWFVTCQSASNFGSDSLSMKFAGGVALISMENQRHASTSAALLTGAQRLRRRARLAAAA